MGKSSFLTHDRPGHDELLFLPLGGCNEIGMNLNLFGHRGKWLMVDYGISFGGDTLPGIDVIMADPDFIENHQKDIVGLVLTHAHEDHLGAIPYIWGDIDCPIYATPFTASFLQAKMRESQFAGKLNLHIMPLNSRFEIGPFDLEYVALTHSIPEPNGLMIRTKAGNIFHTGDWKIDPDPIVGDKIDEHKLQALRKEGVRAMLCDSTNALTSGHSISEGEVAKGLNQVIAGCKGKVAVACFASNIARMRSIIEAAHASKRKVALVGRSLWRMQEVARTHHYLDGVPPFLNEHEVDDYPDDEILLICTGSQGEPRSALTRIARGDHVIKLGRTDTVIFSSRDIPGNELAIARVQNDLARLQVEIITADEYVIHASGHPCRDELVEMYGLIRPEILVPVHGEPRHLIAQAKLGKDCQIPHQMVPENGALIDLGGTGKPKQIDLVYSGRLGLSGEDLLPLDHDSIRHRRQLSQNGIVFVSLCFKSKTRLAHAPKISVIGLVEPLKEERTALIDDIDEVVEFTDGKTRHKKAKPTSNHLMVNEAHLDIEERVRRCVRRFFTHLTGKRPIVIIHSLYQHG